MMYIKVNNIRYTVKERSVEHMINGLYNSHGEEQKNNILISYSDGAVNLTTMKILKDRVVGAGKATVQLNNALATVKEYTGIDLREQTNERRRC